MRIARERPSPGTCSRCSTRRCRCKRMVFHEITPEGDPHAIDNPRDSTVAGRRPGGPPHPRPPLRLRGVPVLWKKVMPRLSAGRVQSVATRIVVERERERMAFHTAYYWDLDRHLPHPAGRPRGHDAAEARCRGRRRGVATGKDFDESRRAHPDATEGRLRRGHRRPLVGRAGRSPFTVRRRSKKPYTRKPYAPFMTSTLQQEAGAQAALQRSADDAHRAAPVRERLHHLHAHRLDDAVGHGAQAARSQIGAYGPSTCPTQPRTYAKKVKNAQEAHEAIRPAGETRSAPPTRSPKGRAARRTGSTS
jgi:DNA topoisomerase-1